MRIWNPHNASGLPASSGEVVSAERSTSTELVVKFTQPLPGITCEPSFQWVNDALTGPGFRIINSTIQSRRFGVLCMGRDGVIEGNKFVDNPGPAILLLNDDDVRWKSLCSAVLCRRLLLKLFVWISAQYDNPGESRMGYMPRNILIRNNTFTRCSRCVPDPYHAGTAISLESVIAAAVVGPTPPATRFGTLPEPFVRVGYRGINNITIRANTIEKWFRGPAILLDEVAGASVQGNTIISPPEAASAVVIADSNDVQVSDNVLGGWSSVPAAIRVAANSTQAVAVKRNILLPQSTVAATHQTEISAIRHPSRSVPAITGVVNEQPRCAHIEPGVLFGRQPIKTANVSSVAACCALCSADPDCAVYSYVDVAITTTTTVDLRGENEEVADMLPASSCTLNSKNGPKKAKSWATSGIVRGGPPAPPTPVPSPPIWKPTNNQVSVDDSKPISVVEPHYLSCESAQSPANYFGTTTGPVRPSTLRADARRCRHH